MMRIVNVIALIVTATAAVLLYHYKYETRTLEKRVSDLSQSIENERQNIAVLKAEWSLLKDPKRIERLTSRFLELAPIRPDQHVSARNASKVLSRIPLRRANSGLKTERMERDVMEHLVDQIVEQPDPNRVAE